MNQITVKHIMSNCLDDIYNTNFNLSVNKQYYAQRGKWVTTAQFGGMWVFGGLNLEPFIL